MKLLPAFLCGLFLAAVPVGAGPFDGTFADERLSVELKEEQGRYVGVIRMDQQSYPLQATGEGQTLRGTFESDGAKFDFSATMADGTLTLETGGATYRLTRQPANPLARGNQPRNPLQAGEPMPPQPGPDAVQPKFRNIEHAAPSGRVVVAEVEGAKSAQALFEQAMAALEQQLGSRPTNLGGMVDAKDTQAEVGFGAVANGHHVQGAILTRVHDGKGTIGIAYDEDTAVAQTMPELIKSLEGALPALAEARAAQWQTAQLPDGSGQLRLPAGYQITGAVKGAVDLAGPGGESMSLGAAFPISTPAGVMTPIGPMEAPLVCDYTDPRNALEQLAPQFSRYYQKLNPASPTIELEKIVEETPTEWTNGKASYILADLNIGGKPYRTFYLLVTMPMMPEQWLLYVSAVTAPRDTFAQSLPQMLEIWSSWKISDKVFQDRMKQALASMRETTRIIQDANRNQQETYARVNAKWGEYFRGKGVITDPVTGKDEEVPLHEMDDYLKQKNQEAGYERWKRVEPDAHLKKPPG